MPRCTNPPPVDVTWPLSIIVRSDVTIEQKFFFGKSFRKIPWVTPRKFAYMIYGIWYMIYGVHSIWLTVTLPSENFAILPFGSALIENFQGIAFHSWQLMTVKCGILRNVQIFYPGIFNHSETAMNRPLKAMTVYWTIEVRDATDSVAV